MAGLRMDTIDSSWLQVRRRRELFEMCTWAEGAVCNVYLLTELYVFESVGNIHSFSLYGFGSATPILYIISNANMKNVFCLFKYSF